MTYDKPTKPGWYWTASTRYGTQAIPCLVVERDGVLRYKWFASDMDLDEKPLSDSSPTIVWGPPLHAPTFSLNPRWDL